jgi:hypothetical protein
MTNYCEPTLKTRFSWKGKIEVRQEFRVHNIYLLAAIVLPDGRRETV